MRREAYPVVHPLAMDGAQRDVLQSAERGPCAIRALHLGAEIVLEAQSLLDPAFCQ